MRALDNEKSFIISLEDWAEMNVNVAIKDANGQTLINEKMIDVPAKKFNLKFLASGLYTVEVSNNLRSINSDLTIENGRVAFGTSTTEYFPVINTGTNYFDVNVLTQGQEVNVWINDENTTIYNTSIDNTAAINKRFSIANLDKGSYTIYARKGNKIVSEQITIK